MADSFSSDHDEVELVQGALTKQLEMAMAMPEDTREERAAKARRLDEITDRVAAISPGMVRDVDDDDAGGIFSWYSWTYLADYVAMGIVILISVFVPDMAEEERFIVFNGDELSYIMYPNRQQRLGTDQNYYISIFAPLAIVLLERLYARKNPLHAMHNMLLAGFGAFTVAHLTSQIFDATLGIPRPDFFSRCGEDVTDPNFDPRDFRELATTCTQEQAYRSFPSGHGVTCYTFMTPLFMYLLGRLAVFDGRGYFWRPLPLYLPIVYCILVGNLRIAEYGHHVVDLIGSALISIPIAVFTYFLFFHGPFDSMQPSEPRDRNRHRPVKPRRI